MDRTMTASNRSSPWQRACASRSPAKRRRRHTTESRSEGFAFVLGPGRSVSPERRDDCTSKAATDGVCSHVRYLRAGIGTARLLLAPPSGRLIAAALGLGDLGQGTVGVPEPVDGSARASLISTACRAYRSASSSRPCER